MAKSKLQHHTGLENWEREQYIGNNKYGIPELIKSDIVGTDFVRLCDHRKTENKSDKIAHFFMTITNLLLFGKTPIKSLTFCGSIRLLLPLIFRCIRICPKPYKYWLVTAANGWADIGLIAA